MKKQYAVINNFNDQKKHNTCICVHESFNFHFNYIKWIAKSDKNMGEKSDIIPVKLLLERSRYSRDVKFPIIDEILPET